MVKWNNQYCIIDMCITVLYVHNNWIFIGVKLGGNYSAMRKSANCSRHHAIADKKIMFTRWNSTSAGLSYRAGDFNKEISGKTKVRRYERGEKKPVNDLPRLYNREFTAHRRHRCRRETRRKEKKRRERKKEDYAPRPRLLIFYASHLMTLVREGPFELGPKRPVRRRRGAFSGTLFLLFVPWNVLTLKRGSRLAHDISAGDLTPGLLGESFRSNENIENSDNNNFTLLRTLQCFYCF